MEITEVQVKLANGPGPLKGYARIVFDGAFVVNDIRILEKDRPFIAMPSRKLRDTCFECSGRNVLTAKFCNWCGQDLGEAELELNPNGRAKLYADVANPINDEFRRKIADAILTEYRRLLSAGTA